MSNTTTTPNMNLIVPTVGTDPGPDWANNINADLSVLDGHNHSTGSGVKITPNGINVNADLPFGGNNATSIRAARFSPQNAPISNSGSDVGELYVSGNELYYNDVTGGNQVQITSSGTVNATSSGISSGTASAAFSAGVLNVKSSSTSFGNVAMQSVVLANSANLVNQLTLQAPVLSGNVTHTLPLIPASQSFMTINTSGTMAGYAPISQGITRSNLAAVGQQISSSSGAFSTTSASATAVTNLSVTITTTGRPVMLMLQSDGVSTANNAVVTYSSTVGSVAGTFYFERGTTIISNVEVPSTPGSTTAALVPPGAFNYLDIPAAGTYTYSVKVACAHIGSTDSFGVRYCVLVAYEL